ncbi:phage tail tape measure protein [Corynebacterium glutamicum]|uniref:phage tail tape measure protein n=1 Tax=Corynebacterium glutamicum TaxID=1718 RepID=UPI000944B34E|nr:phage tail tape measure protein [Corynebacterium glutamicum]OKX85135.1 phage tail tape measure protein [Corynebacterium glutamicum]
MAGGKIDILVSPDVKKFPTEMESGLKGALGTATKIGSAIGLALGGAATIKSVATLGIEFDKQMNTMSAVSQASAEQLAAVERKARDLGKSSDLTATSASDAAAAMTELVKGGFSVEESMSAAKGTLQLASAAQIEAAEAATIQSQALQSFGLDASYAATASDVLAGAANASSAEIGGIAQGLQQSGAVANQFGLTLEDNATALAMFANAGIQGSDAGTLLKSALLALTDQGKPAQAAIEELGLSVYDAQGKFVGMETLFEELALAQSKMTDEQYQAATATLFGSDAMRLAGIAAEQGADGWRTTYAAVTRAGQASEVAAAQAQGLPGVLEAIENQAEDTGIAVYDAFSGLALQGGQGLVSLIETAAPKLEAGAQAIAGGLEAAIPTVERVVDVVATGISDISGSVSVLGGAGLTTIRAFGDVLGGAGGSVLSLAEGLEGMAGPLMLAGGALALGKWKDWDGALRTGAGSVTSLTTRVREQATVQQALAAQQGLTLSSTQAISAAVQAQVPWVGRAAEAYRNNGNELRTWSANSKRWAADASSLAGEVHTLEANFHRGMGAVTGFAGVLGGGLAAGGSLAKSAIGGIVNALGGPLNVAIAGATMAIAGITSAIDRTKRSTELLADLGTQAKETGQALYGSMSRGDLTGEIEALNQGLQGLLDTQKQLADTSPGFWGTIKAMGEDYLADVNPFDGGKTSTDVHDQYQAQKEAAQQAKEFSAAIAEAGITAQDAATAVGGSAAQYDALISSLDLTTQGGQAAKDALQAQRDEYLRMQEITASLVPGSVELSEAMAKIGDESASSEERVSALGDALNNILGIDPDADQALADLHEEIDAITESATDAVDASAGFGDTLFGDDGKLDMAQGNSRSLRDEILSLRESLQKVAVSGGDVDEAFAAQQSALDSLATKYGLSSEEVRNLADQMGLVPDLVTTTVSIGTSEALTGLSQVYAAIEKNQLKVGEPINVDVENVDESKAKLQELGYTVEELQRNADGSGAIKVTADTQQAIDDVQYLVDAVSAVESSKGITFTSNSPEQIETIRGLGVEVESLPNGQFNIKSNTPEETQKLLDLGILVRDKKTGEIQINSNLDEVLRKGRELDARNGRRTKEEHQILQRTIKSTEYANSAGGTSRLSGTMQAHGSVRTAASGMLSQQDAQIARAGSWIMWAEDETRGESFIPHAPEKRGRSTQILAETARIFGLGLVDAAGNPVDRDGTSVAQKNTTYFADGAVRTADEILAFADGQAVAGQQASRSLEGAGYVFGGSNWGDCSSAQGQLALFAMDKPATRGRYMATMNEDVQLAKLGWKPGLGGPGTFSIGWLNGGPGGGHTSGTIDGVNVEMGGARGNGQIGGGAAPASHPQYTHARHIDLPGTSTGSWSDEDMEITSTSVSGYTYKSRGVDEKRVDWGEAARFNEDARRHLGVYDTGGILPAGGIAFNRSSMDEVIVNGPDLRAINNLATNVGQLVNQLSRGDVGGAQANVQAMSAEALREMTTAIAAAEAEVVSFGFTLGGDWLGKARIVQDAERGLIETRMGLAEESAALSAQEREVARARQNLDKVTAAGGELSTSMSRRVADAEETLAKARADGKADKIADAEKKLSRVREDAATELEKSEEKNAKATLDAMEDVQQAEKDLAEMRNLQATAAKRLEAAERTVAAARYQAIADLAEQLGGSLSSVAMGMSDLFGSLAQQAQIMEETRQRLIQEQIERQASDLSAQRARLDLVIAEQDIARVRAAGAISVADAEAALQEARDLAALKGRTGIDAMSDALDRARESGKFMVEDVAQSVIDNSEEVRAAQHAVEAARAQALKDELDAVYRQRSAVLDLAQATLTQQKAVALVDISTRQLAEQSTKLGGLTSQGAQQASNGWGGLGGLFGGIGKVVGGVAGAMASLATGNVVGAITSGVGAITGIGDALKGGRDAWNNRGEIVDSWNGLSLWDKVITGGGLLLGGGVAAAGGLASGALGVDVSAVAGALGAEIANQAVGYAGHGVTSDLEKINLKAEEERDRVLLEAMREQARIDAERAKTDMEYLQQSTILAANVEIAELLGKIATADTTPQADALAAAAIVAAERRDQMVDLIARQLDVAESKAGPRQSITVPLPTDGWVPVATMEALIDTMNRIQTEVELKKDTLEGADYLAART